MDRNSYSRQLKSGSTDADGVAIDQGAALRLSGLTDREFDVLQQLVDGRSTCEAAETLYISPHTVRTHVKSILSKANAHSSLEVVSLAVRAGMRPQIQDEFLARDLAGESESFLG